MKKKLFALLCAGFLISSNISAFFKGELIWRTSKAPVSLTTNIVSKLIKIGLSGYNYEYTLAKTLIRFGYYEQAKKLINTFDEHGETLFHKACYNNKLEMVKLFLPYVTKETIRNGTFSPLYWAFHNKNKQMLTLLLSRCFLERFNKENLDNNCPLDQSIWDDNLEFVVMLVEEGFKVSQAHIQDAKSNTVRDYLQLARNFVTTNNKIQLIQKYKDILRLAFFRSVEKAIKEPRKIESTVLHKVYQIPRLKKKMKEYLLPTEQNETCGFYQFLEKAINNNRFYYSPDQLKTLERMIVSRKPHTKDFSERIKFWLKIFN